MTTRELQYWLPIIEALAVKLAKKTRSIEYIGDYISEGWMAADRALNRYNRNMGASIKTYCYKRILGAMQDHLWWANYRRKRWKTYLFCDLRKGLQLKIENRCEPPTAIESVRLGEVQDYVNRFVFDGVLDDREKRVVLMVYYNNMTQREVGDFLGVCDSRISQIHTGALAKLKRAMEAKR